MNICLIIYVNSSQGIYIPHMNEQFAKKESNIEICLTVSNFLRKSDTSCRVTLSDLASWSFLAIFDNTLLLILSLVVGTKKFIVDCEILVEGSNYEKFI